MVSLGLGMIGMGMFRYGKKAGRLVPLTAGVALMVVPYLIPNVIALVVVCAAITTVPWFLRHA